jgi:hypothetical protein
MQGIRVSLAEVVRALENDPNLKEAWLDLTTGKVVLSARDAPPPGSGPDTHVQVEPFPPEVEERLMESFVYGVDDPEVQARLMAAVRGADAYSRFRQALMGYGGFRQEWVKYYRGELEQHVHEWFEENLGERDGIELTR